MFKGNRELAGFQCMEVDMTTGVQGGDTLKIEIQRCTDNIVVAIDFGVCMIQNAL